MKLKTKLTLSSVLLIVVAIVVCCVLIVSFAWDRAFTDAVNTAVSDIESFRISFSTSYDQNITDEETVQRSYVIHIFRSIPGANEYTLYHDQEYLSNNVGFAPEKLLENNSSISEDHNIQYRNLKIDGVSYLIASTTASGTQMFVLGESFQRARYRQHLQVASTLQHTTHQCRQRSLLMLARHKRLTTCRSKVKK